MKRQILGLFVVMSLFFFACASDVDDTPAPAAEKAEASAMRAMVQRFNLTDVLPEVYAGAEEMYAEGEAKFEVNNLEARASYIAATESYRIIINEGMEGLVRNLQKEIASTKKQSTEIKAEVTQKDKLSAAQDLWDTAEELYANEEFEEALEYFTAALKAYEEAYGQAATLRERALKAMQAADDSSDDAKSRIEKLENEE